ncbi:response regulator transcription factor [Brevibacillus borstelensis]|uniref:response regulator transcription factor n=1 Tax=Brevibacillus borstelensis TaxID=45462 RepID=UPI0030C5DAF6
MTILVVEDDKNINEVVTEYLKEAQFNVISASDGKIAQEMIVQQGDIDLFILDIMLPEISGLELLRIIRNDKIHKDKAIIMLTAINDEYMQVTSFDGLADDYVTKPFSPKVLVKRVQALLRRTGKMTNILQMGDITIDLDSYEAYEQDKKLPLTLREYELLKFLMENRRKVMTRQQLLNSVWGYDHFGDERIVDVHVKNLRKKIKANVITTVKGVGYKIEPPSIG